MDPTPRHSHNNRRAGSGPVSPDWAGGVARRAPVVAGATASRSEFLERTRLSVWRRHQHVQVLADHDLSHARFQPWSLRRRHRAGPAIWHGHPPEGDADQADSAASSTPRSRRSSSSWTARRRRQCEHLPAGLGGMNGPTGHPHGRRSTSTAAALGAPRLAPPGGCPAHRRPCRARNPMPTGRRPPRRRPLALAAWLPCSRVQPPNSTALQGLCQQGVAPGRPPRAPPRRNGGEASTQSARHTPMFSVATPTGNYTQDLPAQVGVASDRGPPDSQPKRVQAAEL